jgi:hypothetical protein
MRWCPYQSSRCSLFCTERRAPSAGGLLASFAALVATAAGRVDPALLARADWGEVWPRGVSIGVLSFGAQNVVPTLFAYLGRDPARTRAAVLLGTALPLGMYSLWELVALGAVPPAALGASPDQNEFLARIAGGVGGAGAAAVPAFSVCAIGSSMAGASVSFVDFWQDGLASLGLVRVPGAPDAPPDAGAGAHRAGAGAAGGGRAVAAAAAMLPAFVFAVLPPPSRTKRTRLVPPPVLSGHVSAQQAASEDSFLSALETAVLTPARPPASPAARWNAGWQPPGGVRTRHDARRAGQGVLFGVSLYGVLPSLMVWRLRNARSGSADAGRVMPGRVPGGDAAVMLTGLGSAALVLPELARIAGLR